MKHELAARRHNGLKHCTCGERWVTWGGYEMSACNSQVGRSPRTGKFQTFGVAKMSRREFEFELIFRVPIGVAHKVGSIELRHGAMGSARSVEGGYCYWEIMGPWAEEMYGPHWDRMIDTD